MKAAIRFHAVAVWCLVWTMVLTCVQSEVVAQEPVILTFDVDGSLTWSNAYPDAFASVERLTDVSVTGASVIVTETLGIADGSTAVYHCTVTHPPIVNGSVTIADGAYSWNDRTGSSSPASFLGTVSSYESGRVSAIYLSAPAVSGTVIRVEYGYPPTAAQQWAAAHSVLTTSEVTRSTVDMGKRVGLIRVRNIPSPMVLVPGGDNSGTNPLGTHSDYGPEDHGDCYYPASYSLAVNSFYMSRHEVTIALWDEVAEWAASHGYDLTTTQGPGWDGPDHPVQSVTWYMCVKWCNALSEMLNLLPAYYEDADRTLVYRRGTVDVQNAWVRWDTGCRLPTDEEWEYAARGGLVGTRFPWGDTISHGEANYSAKSFYDYDVSSTLGYHPAYYTGDGLYTSPVGSFAPNAFGLYDMAGNVWEWCHDEHCDRGRVTHGGSWSTGPSLCRIGLRQYEYPSAVRNDQGFRVVLPAGS